MALFRKKSPVTPTFAEGQGLPTHLPRHVAIIMDGNGRWAKARHQPRAFGHRAGVEAMRAIIRNSSDIGIEALSFYAFSTENWSRPADEVGALMGLLIEFFGKEIDELHANNVCIRILGDVPGMPEPQRGALLAAMEKTRANTGLKLNLAVNYGARNELLQAVRALAAQVAQGNLAPQAIDEQALEAALYTGGLPQVDLLIRTSGEQRLSNFLLYQCAYAELVFVDTLWPDFDVAAYHAALRTYGQRQRRFGGV